MRTETEMMNLILQIAETLKIEAVAISGSRTEDRALKDEFQDYDVVYLVENFEELIQIYLGWTSSANVSSSKRLLWDIAVSTSCFLKMVIALI